MGKWSKDATILLIEEVKRRPFIYDPSHKSYHDRGARRVAMQEIAALLSQLRPNTQGEEIKVRWSALRSAFQGCISKMRRQLNGTLTTEFTKVWYFDEMLFLCKVRPARNGSFRIGNDGTETRDSFVPNEDVLHPVTIVDESMDGSQEPSEMCEVYTSESPSRKESSADCLQRESLIGGMVQSFDRDNLPGENLQRDNHKRASMQNENLQGDNLQIESVQSESLQRESIQRDNPEREVLQRECHPREVLQRENMMRGHFLMENSQRENFQRENFQRGNLQLENIQRENRRESLQRGNFQREVILCESPVGVNMLRDNVRRGNFSGDNLQMCDQREDTNVLDPLYDRDPPIDSVTSKRKRSIETGYSNSLDFSVKKLMDQTVDDPDFIFGKLIAHELKSVKSPVLKKKLKHKIMLDIIEIQNLQD